MKRRLGQTKPNEQQPITFAQRGWIGCLLVCHFVFVGPLFAQDSADSASNPVQVPQGVEVLSNLVVQIESSLRADVSVIVKSVAVTPDGNTLAVACDDHTIRILSVLEMKLSRTLTGHTDLIKSLAFDDSGERLISVGNDGRMLVYDCQAGYQVIKKVEGVPALSCVAFSPDGRTIAAGDFGGQIYLIEQQGQNTVNRTVQCNTKDLRSLAFRDDGQKLVAGGRNGHLYVISMAQKDEIRSVEMHLGRIHSLSFAYESPVVVSAGRDGTVALFDTDSMAEVARVAVSTGQLFSARILDDRHVAVAGSDDVIRIVDMQREQIVEQINGHQGSIAAMTSSGNLLFSGGFDATLRRWELSGVVSPDGRSSVVGNGTN